MGALHCFTASSILAGIYSAILFATSAYGPDYKDITAQQNHMVGRYSQGGYQLAGICIASVIGIVFGMISGIIAKFSTKNFTRDSFFNDYIFIDRDSDNGKFKI